MKIIIAGAYAIGTYLAKLLSRNNQNIVLMDESIEHLEKIGADYDLMTMNASCTSPRSLKEAGADKADLFIAVTPDESKNLAACTLAKALGMMVIIEGVENEDQMNYLKGTGADYLQGYYLNKPLPVKKFEELYL